MPYRSLRDCLHDLAAAGHLVRIEEEVDPCLEAAEIHRRVFQGGGPAVFYARVKGSPFPMVSNLFGTMERVRFVFRDTLKAVERLIRLKIDPGEALRHPLRALAAARSALHMLPRFVRRGPVLAHETTIDHLPQQKSWPLDGGAFVTLPQVYTEDAQRPGWRHSNLGMYRIQLSGGRYEPSREVGLHYQIHRGIGVHHAAALLSGKPFPVHVFVGGPPAMTVAAVMPLPEGLPELTFAGALNGHRIRLIRRAGVAGAPALPIHADADFCITGHVVPGKLLPEGPFGDHLGYYSLAHDFPVLRVEHVYHREGAIWPFTVVGRPPQEDTMFGQLIHELTGPVIPTVVPGVRAVHAVDAAGVHPLLLAIGSERYAPFTPTRRPMELLTQANAILGQGQMSLAKYLLIAAADDDPGLDVHDIPAFLAHVLRRVDWQRDLHFQTCTTIDTLDYSGSGLNEGSKVVIAAVGPPRRELPAEIPADLRLPEGFGSPRICLPGVLAVEGPKCSSPTLTRSASEETPRDTTAKAFCASLTPESSMNRFPLIVIVDDGEFTARTLHNFLWVTFTRSNPAADINGIGSFIADKHWGCRGSLVIDARLKLHHAPPLEADATVAKRVERLAAPGGPLHGII
jgi:4-hydroxy-3-polyprenylbenzoate decarboxylase